MSLFGRFYRVMTFGESHSAKVGCVIEGFPSNFSVNLQKIQKQLNRRRPGQSLLTTPRDQKDRVECISGLENNKTLGSPLCFVVANQNIKKKDYSHLENIPRPGHADFTYLKKYGIKASSGGGRSSARQTIGRVIAGALAKQFLQTKGIYFAAWVKKVNTFAIPQEFNNSLVKNKITNEQIERRGQIIQLENGHILIPGQNNEYYEFSCQNQQLIEHQIHSRIPQIPIKVKSNLRCPHPKTAAQIYFKIQNAKQNNDSLGGIIEACIYGLPQGLGEPCFDKFPALMAHAMLSIPATKGFQFGSGFQCAQMMGSQHNDKFNADLTLKTNFSGGTLGGITTGQTFNFRTAFKPVSSIGKPQQTHDINGNPIILKTQGRHDPCVLPRAPPIVDNMAAIVVMDLLLSKHSNMI